MPRVAEIYLDHHATSPLDQRVFDTMRPWFCEFAGNSASASHLAGDRAHQAVEVARSEIAFNLGCDAREVVFTSGATEANNLALQGFFAGRKADSAELLIGGGEHRSVSDVAQKLQRQGTVVRTLPVNSVGQVEPFAVENAISQKTRMISVQWANHEVGAINDIRQIAAICQKHNVTLHVDAVQAVGKIPTRLDHLPISLMSLSAHKLYGPQGIGVLIVRRDDPTGNRTPVRLTPLIAGGGQEGGLRSGTLPVALIMGMAAALRSAVAEMPTESSRLAGLRSRLFQGLSQALPQLILNGPDWTHSQTARLPGNLNISWPNVDPLALWATLKKTGLAISAGAACRSSVPEPSPVLLAMGRSTELSLAALRFGIGRGNTEHEIDEAVSIIRNLA